MKDVGSRCHAGALGLWNVVRGPECQRFKADLRVTPRQGRGHDNDEVALLCQHQRQCGNAVKLRHLDVEHGDVRVDALKLVDGVEARAQRCCDNHVRFRCDPAGNQASDDDGIVNNHHAQRFLPRRSRGRGTYQRNTHHSPATAEKRLYRSVTPRAVQPPDLKCQIRPTSWNFAVTMSLSNGFIMYSLAPACSARAICATSFSVVQNTTLGWSPPGMRRRLPRNSKPSITGMFQSSRIASGRRRLQACRSFSPSSA